jgi:DNA-directed RNA polymerase subunit F
MKDKITSETPMTASQVLAALETVKETEGELNYRAQRTHEYLSQFVTLKPAQVKELIDKLKALNVPRVREQHLYKLADVLPSTPNDIKTVLQGYAVTITNENLQKMADLIAEYVK